MRARIDTQHLYNITVSGVTVTVPGPDDVVEMYRGVRTRYPRDISVELRPVDDSSHLSNKVDWQHGDH